MTCTAINLFTDESVKPREATDDSSSEQPSDSDDQSDEQNNQDDDVMTTVTTADVITDRTFVLHQFVWCGSVPRQSAPVSAPLSYAHIHIIYARLCRQ